MGRDDDGLNDEAESIALEAGAVERCEYHEDCILTTDDAEANTLAYKIATKRWKDGGRSFELRELTDAIKRVIDEARSRRISR